MTARPSATPPPVARLRGVSLHHRKVTALSDVDLDLPAGRMVGIIGPDGVGKSSLLSLVAGARAIQSGRIEVLGGDMGDAGHRARVCSRIAYLPQGLGKNLYRTLSVFDNVDFFGRLFGQESAERERRAALLLRATGLAPFKDRRADQLSGGMKQKLGLCCALIHEPDLLILDEPTTGVDPLSRRQFWELIARIRAGRPGMSVLVATAYMEEAERFDWLVAMNEGRILESRTPRDILARTGARSLEESFVHLLPAARRADYRPVEIVPRRPSPDGAPAVEASDLTMRFGDFVAVDHVSFHIDRGEIFGFIGSNGCGKTTTMKLLTGLLAATEGQARLFGRPIDPRDLETRRRVGYMTQGFSLYGELTVRQNLELHARLFGMPRAQIPARVRQIAERFGLAAIMEALPPALPLGERQRLSLAVAMVHGPEILILDEPTSGVDPVARDGFWRIMIDLARSENVTIFISTHFMNEAERCDRVALMHAGRVLVTDTPAAIVAQRGARTLEDAFVSRLEETEERRTPESSELAAEAPSLASAGRADQPAGRRRGVFSLRRLLGYTRCEGLELRNDPIRLTLAGLGSAILMVVLAYGISMDVENLKFAVLDGDQTALSQDYAFNLAGSRYFVERPPLRDHADLDQRMRAGELSLAIEIPHGFARDVARGTPVEIGAWIDGTMPMRTETIKGYVQGMHQHWLAAGARTAYGAAASSGFARIETRFRYNPDVKSLPAMVPAVIPLLLLLLPAMLTAVSVVREKELGSIINFYVTPVTRLEFLLGKQIPNVVLAMFNFLMLVALALFVFRVPIKGSFITLALAAFLYVIAATAIGLVISSFMRSQIAALFGTALITIVPAVQFSGILNPVSSLEGAGRVIGGIFPTSHFVTIARGTFSKGLDFTDLRASFVPLVIAIPVLIALGVLLLRKQER